MVEAVALGLWVVVVGLELVLEVEFALVWLLAVVPGVVEIVALGVLVMVVE